MSVRLCALALLAEGCVFLQTKRKTVVFLELIQAPSFSGRWCECEKGRGDDDSMIQAGVYNVACANQPSWTVIHASGRKRAAVEPPFHSLVESDD